MKNKSLLSQILYDVTTLPQRCLNVVRFARISLNKPSKSIFTNEINTLYSDKVSKQSNTGTDSKDPIKPLQATSSKVDNELAQTHNNKEGYFNCEI